MLPCQGEFQVSRSRIGATESGATVSSLYFSVEQRDFAETYLDLDKQQSSFSFQKEQKRKKQTLSNLGSDQTLSHKPTIEIHCFGIVFLFCLLAVGEHCNKSLILRSHEIMLLQILLFSPALI